MLNNILLFPGGFKPFHDGHLSILNSHIFNIDDVHFNKIHIIISNKDRDNIIANSTYWFLNNIKNALNKFYNTQFYIEICDIPSPIRKCYGLVGSSDINDKFCLVSSNKDDDIKRQTEFIKAYQKGGKYYDETKGEKTISLSNVNIMPLKYQNRDEYISSTIVRNDILNDNYNNFKQAYNYMLKNKIIDKKLIQRYFSILRKRYL